MPAREVAADIPCSADDCPNEARKGGLCWAHLKRRTLRKVVAGSIAKRPKSGMERLREAALAYADADAEEDFARAEENLRKSAVAAGASAMSELVANALARLKAAGVKLGRPPKVEPRIALALCEELGVTAAATHLNVSRWALWRAKRIGKR